MFAENRGDPVNIDLSPGKNDERCIAISGGTYLSLSFCEPLPPDPSHGPYTVMPSESGDPTLVVGLLPRGKDRVAVTVGNSGTIGVSHKTVFMAVLTPDAFGSTGDVPVKVEFG